MRQIRDTDNEENARIVNKGWYDTIKRDFIKPEPEGTIVLLPFRITGYEADSDGSAMAQLDSLALLDNRLLETGWSPSRIGIHNGYGFVVSEEELLDMLRRHTDAAPGEAELRSVAFLLIAWAARLEHAVRWGDVYQEYCRFCGASRDVLHENELRHADDCLHLRARALRGESE